MTRIITFQEIKRPTHRLHVVADSVADLKDLRRRMEDPPNVWRFVSATNRTEHFRHGLLCKSSRAAT